VVIALIGILSTLVLANLNSARERSRDAQRKSDLRNIQTALRLYYNDIGRYPSPPLPTGGDPWTVSGTTYMSVFPKDPLSSQSYRYTQPGGDTDSYMLETCLENKSDDKGVAITDAWCSTSWEYKVRP